MSERGIYIGLGSNLPWHDWPPRRICRAALDDLQARGIGILGHSSWYASAAVPPSGQPDFVNAAAALDTDLSPRDLLNVLHAVEAAFGRVRSVPNAARTLDIDLLSYGDLVTGTAPCLPHPRLHMRGFMLLPLRDIAPDWRDPRTNTHIEDLIAALPAPVGVHRIPDDAP